MTLEKDRAHMMCSDSTRCSTHSSLVGSGSKSKGTSRHGGVAAVAGHHNYQCLGIGSEDEDFSDGGLLDWYSIACSVQLILGASV